MTKTSSSKIVHVANIDFRDQLEKKIADDGFSNFSAGVYKILHDYAFGQIDHTANNQQLDELLKIEKQNREFLEYIASKLDTTVTDVKLAILGTFSKTNLDAALHSMNKELDEKQERTEKQKQALANLKNSGLL